MMAEVAKEGAELCSFPVVFMDLETARKDSDWGQIEGCIPRLLAELDRVVVFINDLRREDI